MSAATVWPHRRPGDQRTSEPGNGFRSPVPRKRVHRCRSLGRRYECSAPDHQCRRGMPEVFQPTDALLLFDGDACRIDLLLESVAAFEFLPVPELDRRQTKRETFGRYGQAGMHQNSTDRMVSRTSALCPTVAHLVCDSMGCFFPLKRKLRRIVHHQHGTVTRCKAVVGGLKMTRQDVPLVHTFVGEKPIRRLGVRQS